jgi:hypothetical protein
VVTALGDETKKIEVFFRKIVLALAPGVYLRLVMHIDELTSLILENPLRAYEIISQILGGEEAMRFFDHIVALHVESKTGDEVPEGKVLGLLREGRVKDLMQIIERYLQKGN